MLWRAPQAPVAQLDRVSVFETEGWEFKPLRARQQFTAAQMTLCRIAQSTIREQFGASAGGFAETASQSWAPAPELVE